MPPMSGMLRSSTTSENGFNAGCVEAAVMSGRLAAAALSGLPALEDIVGYDHP